MTVMTVSYGHASKWFKYLFCDPELPKVGRFMQLLFLKTFGLESRKYQNPCLCLGHNGIIISSTVWESSEQH